MMIVAPGGYRFGDYWKLGLPVMAWWLACAVQIIPIFWRFHPRSGLLPAPTRGATGDRPCCEGRR
ncbi:MAG: hypothetical protein L0H79_13950 [Intrasporangium sp.]|uniref:hypothetical protein n=1 Tax=Intrasporangium sp. TaxID=1925024 RepID=UPI002648EB7A|nr:hypothetical protein [Intrasporangium sp.]MDN5796843.1 hypothetical protein [Intrasporangium sp.]